MGRYAARSPLAPLPVDFALSGLAQSSGPIDWAALEAALDSIGRALAWRSGLTAFALAPPLLLAAARLGWLDPRPGVRSERKSQIPAAPIGGLLLALALASGWWFSSAQAGHLLATFGLPPDGARDLTQGLQFPPPLPLLGLLLALLLGCLDDLWRGGLGPLPKFCGQLLSALPLGLWAHGAGYLGQDGAAAAGLACLAAVAAMNLVNTWDNADGAALSLGAVLALPGGHPALLGACLGLLPWNLRRPRSAGPLPQLYLGDGGSHLLGMSIALQPELAPILLLPALDLTRLSIERWRRGSRPWIGDRRHLSHLLSARGLARPLVLLLLALALLPAIHPATWPLGALLYLALWRFASLGDPGGSARRAP